MAASQQCGAFLLQFIYFAGMDITKVYFQPLKPGKAPIQSESFVKCNLYFYIKSKL